MSRVSLLALCALAWGCAITSKATPVEVHWYTPEIAHREAASTPSTAPAPAPALRLAFVTSGTDLGDRIEWGDGAYRVGYYEDRRWTERPARFATSELRRALFESHRFQPAEEDAAPTLEVELVSFQEIRTAHTHLGRVAMHVRLTRGQGGFDATISRDEPVTGERFEDVVAAIARALGDVSEEVAQRVQESFRVARPDAAGGR